MTHSIRSGLLCLAAACAALPAMAETRTWQLHATFGDYAEQGTWTFTPSGDTYIATQQVTYYYGNGLAPTLAYPTNVPPDGGRLDGWITFDSTIDPGPDGNWGIADYSFTTTASTDGSLGILHFPDNSFTYSGGVYGYGYFSNAGLDTVFYSDNPDDEHALGITFPNLNNPTAAFLADDGSWAVQEWHEHGIQEAPDGRLYFTSAGRYATITTTGNGPPSTTYTATLETPEPASVASLLIGLLALGFNRRRRGH